MGISCNMRLLTVPKYQNDMSPPWFGVVMPINNSTKRKEKQKNKEKKNQSLSDSLWKLICLIKVINMSCRDNDLLISLQTQSPNPSTKTKTVICQVNQKPSQKKTRRSPK